MFLKYLIETEDGDWRWGGGKILKLCAHKTSIVVANPCTTKRAHAQMRGLCARAHDAGNMRVNAYAYIWYMLDNYRPPLVHVLP